MRPPRITNAPPPLILLANVKLAVLSKTSVPLEPMEMAPVPMLPSAPPSPICKVPALTVVAPV